MVSQNQGTNLGVPRARIIVLWGVNIGVPPLRETTVASHAHVAIFAEIPVWHDLSFLSIEGPCSTLLDPVHGSALAQVRKISS